MSIKDWREKRVIETLRRKNRVVICTWEWLSGERLSGEEKTWETDMLSRGCIHSSPPDVLVFSPRLQSCSTSLHSSQEAIRRSEARLYPDWYPVAVYRVFREKDCMHQPENSETVIIMSTVQVIWNWQSIKGTQYNCICILWDVANLSPTLLSVLE